MNVDNVDDFKVIEGGESMFAAILSKEAFDKNYGEHFPNLNINKAIIPPGCTAQSGSQYFKGPIQVNERASIEMDKSHEPFGLAFD